MNPSQSVIEVACLESNSIFTPQNSYLIWKCGPEIVNDIAAAHLCAVIEDEQMETGIVLSDAGQRSFPMEVVFCGVKDCDRRNVGVLLRTTY